MALSKLENVVYSIFAFISIVSFAAVLVFSGKISGKTQDMYRRFLDKTSSLASSVMALSDVAELSDEEIKQQIAEEKAKSEEILKENGLPIVKDFSAEEEKALMDGNISSEDAEKILLRKNSNTDSFINKSSRSVSEDTSSEGEGGDDSITEKITRLYSLKAYYLGLLGSMLNQAKAEYSSAGTDSDSKGLAYRYIERAGALEAECDSKVYDILSQLESELAQKGRDTSVVESIEEAYIKEKRLKKSYYLTNYMD